MNAPRIAVIGSLNVDYIAQVGRLPVAGQTVPATALLRRFGGKGANQALACARQGARVAMIGCVGKDADGDSYLAHFRRNRIDTAGVKAIRGATTGTALIAVARDAENLIIVAPGANGRVSPAHIRGQRPRIENASAVVMQFEIPFEAILHAMGIAGRAKIPVVLNPSPLLDGFPWGRFPVQTLVVNEDEALRLFGIDAHRAIGSAGALRKRMAKWRIGRVVITCGPQPTIGIDQARAFAVPTIRVKPVDTVGAGDAFTGAFAARVAEGADFATAILHGNCAGALATLKPGAQEASPGRAAVVAAARRALRGFQ